MGKGYVKFMQMECSSLEMGRSSLKIAKRGKKGKRKMYIERGIKKRNRKSDRKGSRNSDKKRIV